MHPTLYASLISLTLIAAPNTVHGVELYGEKLQNTTKEQLEAALTEAGATEKTAEGETSAVYKSYDSAQLLIGSKTLHVGFNQENNKFAFLEYEILPHYHERVLSALTEQYGEPQSQRGKFITDQTYNWGKDGITIQLYRDFFAYRSRLVYAAPQQMAALQNAYKNSHIATLMGEKLDNNKRPF